MVVGAGGGPAVPRPGRLPTGQLAGLLASLPPVRIRRGDVLLGTERLVLRRFTDADLDLLVELDGDPEVMRYITGGRPTSRRSSATRSCRPSCATTGGSRAMVLTPGYEVF